MKTLYFSPTGNTKKACEYLESHIKRKLESDLQMNINFERIDFTNISVRSSTIHQHMIGTSFCKDDMVIMGLPVYAGRLPNVLLKYLSMYKGQGARMIIVLSYGNRHYDDAAKEAYQLFSGLGFKVLSVVCVIGEHSFSNNLAKNRPDAHDFEVLETISDIMIRLLERSKIDFEEGVLHTNMPLMTHSIQNLENQEPLKPYYKPLDNEGIPFSFKDIKPVTLKSCIACGICASICPMGSISPVNFKTIEGPCIKCCACVKVCPVDAKVFDDLNFIKHLKELEQTYQNEYREIELFL